MAFLSLFGKSSKPRGETPASSVETDIRESLAEISERLHKIETKQRETSLQLEEIDGFLQGDVNTEAADTEKTLVGALVALADAIGDFYYFANDADDADGAKGVVSPLFEQAQMMWNAAKNAAEAAGLEIIDAAREPFDFRLHSAEGIEQDDGIPNGYVAKTVKCGYIYKKEVARRAAVVVNKINASNNVHQKEAAHESWN